MKRFVISAAALLALAALVVFSPLSGVIRAGEDETAAVKKVIETAYVEGIHINQDVDAIRAGFHGEFTMVMYRDGEISKMSIDEWVERIEEGKKKNPDPPKVETTHEFAMVEVEGNAAVARIEMYKDGKHVFTDFMALYKFPDGWKIVNKIYYRHPG
jgi:hypothetical protein